MFTKEQLNEIKDFIQNFFKKMSFSVEAEVLIKENNVLSINLETDEPQILIGEKGETLIEIQNILKLFLRRKFKTEQLFYIDLDINNYKKKKINYLKEIVKQAVQEVFLTKKEKILPPMPSYERKIIHLEIAQRQGVVSESFGQEPTRRIIIKPKF